LGHRGGASALSDRLISLDHSEIVHGVQMALTRQLERDGRLGQGLELGLLFYAEKHDGLNLVAQVRHNGKLLFELKGGRPHLAAVATQLALDKLPPMERSQFEPNASVRWRAIKFTGNESTLERFMVDVEFHKRP